MDKKVLVAYILLNSLVLTNALLHPPHIGYDARFHYKYVETLSQFRMPGKSNRLYYTPPTYYILPALMRAAGLTMSHVGKITQSINVICSLILTYLMLLICDAVTKDKKEAGRSKLFSLFLLGMIPTYYRTFAIFRPEPLITLLGVLLAYAMVKMLDKDCVNGRLAALAGLVLGALVSTKQQGLWFIPAAGAFFALMVWKRWESQREHIKAASIFLAASIISGGWFYLYLYSQYGSFLEFNRHRDHEFFLSGQPMEFYTDLCLDRLFTRPVLLSYQERLIPRFYSDVWGDYCGYFFVYGRWRRRRYYSGPQLGGFVNMERWPREFYSNVNDVSGYLGRVNQVSLFPTLILVASFFMGLNYLVKLISSDQTDDKVWIYALMALLMASTIVCYFLFLSQYSNKDGETIKATYIVHILPFNAILGSGLMSAIKRKSRVLFFLTTLLLALVAAHNIPTYITHYNSLVTDLEARLINNLKVL